MDNPLIIRRNIFEDSRGSFEKLYDNNTVKSLSLPGFEIKQVNRSSNKARGTVRGLHYQKGSAGEAKIICILQGKIRDYAVDLRADKNSFGKVWEFDLSYDSLTTLYLPKGFAHGFQTLENNSELLYLHSHHYCADYESGINILDPALNIQLPLEISNISERDKAFCGINEVLING